MKTGDEAINPHQISGWWRKYIKKPFGITADFYALKHSNTTETIRLSDWHHRSCRTGSKDEWAYLYSDGGEYLRCQTAGVEK